MRQFTGKENKLCKLTEWKLFWTTSKKYEINHFPHTMVGWIQIFWRKGLKLIKKIENEKTNKVNAIYAISKFDHIGRSISKILLCNKILSCYKIYNTIHMLFFWCGILHLYTFVNVNPHRSFVTVVLEYLKETEDNKSSVNLRWLSWPFDQPWMYWKNGFDIYLLNISRKNVFLINLSTGRFFYWSALKND